MHAKGVVLCEKACFCLLSAFSAPSIKRSLLRTLLRTSVSIEALTTRLLRTLLRSTSCKEPSKNPSKKRAVAWPPWCAPCLCVTSSGLFLAQNSCETKKKEKPLASKNEARCVSLPKSRWGTLFLHKEKRVFKYTLHYGKLRWVPVRYGKCTVFRTQNGKKCPWIVTPNGTPLGFAEDRTWARIKYSVRKVSQAWGSCPRPWLSMAWESELQRMQWRHWIAAAAAVWLRFGLSLEPVLKSIRAVVGLALHCHSFQGRKRIPNPNFLVWISSGGVGVFHVKGWGPKSSVCPRERGNRGLVIVL